MSLDLAYYNTLLFLQQPWLDTPTNTHKFEQLYHATPEEHLQHQPLYDVAFIKPLTSKRKYFHRMIQNEATGYLNSFHTAISSCFSESEKKYLVHTALTKKLKDKFNRTEEVIKTQGFFVNKIGDKNLAAAHTDNTYVLQFLKYQLIRIYLEIQDSYSSLAGDQFTEAEIHSIYFSEEMPATSYIVEADKIDLPGAELAQLPKESPKFKSLKADFRENIKGVLSYNEIITKTDQFAVFEAELYEIGLIDLKYTFIKKRGHNEKMAAMYHLLMVKKYFHPFSFSGGRKEVKDLQVRRFLNHRYNTDIDKEFRNFKDSKKLDQYLNLNPTLRILVP